jgi:hypothetical protein
MTGIPIIDIDAVPEEEQAALAASIRALLRLQDLDVGDGDHILCLNGGELALVTPDNIPVARFASGITPVEIVAVLPTTGNFAGRLVFLTTDKKLYRHTGTAWTAAIDASDLSGQLTDAQLAAISAAKITGQVVASQIADAAIGTAKFAAGIRAVEVVAVLPSTGNAAGRVVFLTTDNKLYRYNGSAWVATVAATDVTGTLTDAQIAAIAAAKITGQVVAAQIADAQIGTAKFAAGIRPVEVVSALPSTGNTAGRVVFLTTDNKLYRYDGAAWVAGVAAGDVTGTLTDAQLAAISAAKITGQVVASQIADAAIGTAKFAAGLRPVEVVSALPSTGNTAGRVVFLTTDNKLYRYNGSAYVAGVAAGDVTGTLTDAQLAAISAAKITGAITTTQITDDAVTTAKIAAAAVTAAEIAAGAIIAGKIAAGVITTAEIAAGTITAANIAADTITAGQIAAGAIGASEIAAGAVVAGKIAAGVITATEIAAAAITGAKIAAGTITAANILAGTITTAEIAAGTITAANIAADTITAGQIAAGAIGASEIAAGAVVAGKIAAGVITATEIAAAAITGAKIAAGTITAANLLAGTITANEIAAATITGAKIAAGTITAANIAADTITAGQIAAGAIGASEIAAGAVIAGKIAAGVITATEIAAATITGAKIAAGTITAANLLAGTITANEIAAATITGAKIAAGTIQGSNIAADTITAGQIAAAAIGATEIAANAITADKMIISMRDIDPSGIEFSTAGNVLSWSAGAIEYTDDANANASAAIASGSVTWLSGKVYVYWAKGATTLSTSTTYAGAKGSGNVIVGIYEGADNLNLKRGRTIIAGGKIRTGSIAADKLNVANLAAVSAVLGNVDISSANIGTLTVGTINIANGAVTDAKADQTAPGAPGAPVLTPLTTEVDKDGGLDAALTAAWTAPVSGRTPRKYRVEIWRRKGDKGTDGNNVTGYTFWKNQPSNQLNHTFKANSEYFHKCRIFPISPNDIEGTGSAYTTVGAKLRHRPFQCSMQQKHASLWQSALHFGTQLTRAATFIGSVISTGLTFPPLGLASALTATAFRQHLISLQAHLLTTPRF